MRKIAVILLALFVLVGPASAAGGKIAISPIVDVSRDQLSQNETPIAVNPANPANLITGANDWNYNDGCAVNASSDGGKTWTPTLPNGFLPGITKYTNDPNVAGTGAYDAGGDPSIAFSPDGKIAYYVCQAFDFTSPFDITLLMNRSTDGGLTWQQTGLVPGRNLSGQRDDERVERQVRRPRQPPRRPDERRRVRLLGRVQRNQRNALARVRRGLARPGRDVDAEQGHGRQREEQPGPAHRH